MALTYERARTNLERGQAACERGEIGPGLLYFIESWRSAVEAGDPGLAHAARASLSAWRHQAPRLLREFPHTDKDRISIVAFRPDGKAVATAGTDNMVRLWDPPPATRSARPCRITVQSMPWPSARTRRSC